MLTKQGGSFLFRKLNSPRHPADKNQNPNSKVEANSSLPLDVDQAITEVQSAMGNSSDLQVHRFQAFTGDTGCALVYLKSFVDIEQLNKSVLSPLLQLAVPSFARFCLRLFRDDSRSNVPLSTSD